MPGKDKSAKSCTNFFEIGSIYYNSVEFLRVFKILILGIGFVETFGNLGIIYSIAAMAFIFIWFNVFAQERRVPKLIGNFFVISIALFLWHSGSYFGFPLIVIIFEVLEAAGHDIWMASVFSFYMDSVMTSPTLKVISFDCQDIVHASKKKLSDKELSEKIAKIRKNKRKIAKMLLKI